MFVQEWMSKQIQHVKFCIITSCKNSGVGKVHLLITWMSPGGLEDVEWDDVVDLPPSSLTRKRE